MTGDDLTKALSGAGPGEVVVVTDIRRLVPLAAVSDPDPEAAERLGNPWLIQTLGEDEILQGDGGV